MTSADLYKTEITVPIAFEVAATQSEDIGASTRRAVRDAISDGRILERAARDIRRLLLGDSQQDNKEELETEVMHLWDDRNGFVKYGVSYGKDLDVPFDPEDEPDEEIQEGYGTLLTNKE